MGVSATLETNDGRLVRGLPDPSGGTFDAAGDFDELLAPDDLSFSVWHKVDPFGEIVLRMADMAGLLGDLQRLSGATAAGPLGRGLARLVVMVERCVADPSLSIRFSGD